MKWIAGHLKQSITPKLLTHQGNVLNLWRKVNKTLDIQNFFLISSILLVIGISDFL